MFPEHIEGVDPATQGLIATFSSTYHDAQECLQRRRYEDARTGYLELLRLYQQLRESRVDPIHTNIAYSCIEDLYNDLQHKVEVPVISHRGFAVGVSVSMLLVLISIWVIMDPSVVGLTVLDIRPDVGTLWLGPTQFTIDGIETYNLNEFAQSQSELTYLVSDGEGISVYVDGPIVTFVPKRGYSGTASVTVLAYELDKSKLAFKQELDILVL